MTWQKRIARAIGFLAQTAAWASAAGCVIGVGFIIYRIVVTASQHLHDLKLIGLALLVSSIITAIVFGLIAWRKKYWNHPGPPSEE